MTTTPRRMRSRSVALGITMLAAASLSGCGASEPEYAAMCVDPQTQERLEDSECDDSENPRDYDEDGGGGGFFWFYMATNSGSRVPAVGQSYDPKAGTYKGSSLVKSGKAVQRGGMPKAGATSAKSVSSKGGFGTSKGVSSS